MELLKCLFDLLIARGHKFSDYEARCVLPCLVEKSGQPNDAIRRDFRRLLERAAALYSPNKLLLAVKVGGGVRGRRGMMAVVLVVNVNVAWW